MKTPILVMGLLLVPAAFGPTADAQERSSTDTKELAQYPYLHPINIGIDESIRMHLKQFNMPVGVNPNPKTINAHSYDPVCDLNNQCLLKNLEERLLKTGSSAIKRFKENELTVICSGKKKVVFREEPKEGPRTQLNWDYAGVQVDPKRRYAIVVKNLDEDLDVQSINLETCETEKHGDWIPFWSPDGKFKAEKDGTISSCPEKKPCRVILRLQGYSGIGAEWLSPDEVKLTVRDESERAMSTICECTVGKCKCR